MSLLSCYNEYPSSWKWHFEEYRVSGWYTNSYWSATSKTYWPTLDSPSSEEHGMCVPTCILSALFEVSVDIVWHPLLLAFLVLESNTHKRTRSNTYIYSLGWTQTLPSNFTLYFSFLLKEDEVWAHPSAGHYPLFIKGNVSFTHRLW